MAKLILSMDGLVLKEIQLSSGRITIGRKPSNDVQIENLAISGEHAAVVTILNDSFLEDLNSTNGTMVNGQPIKKHVLRNNDIVELGKYRLKYLLTPTVVPDLETTGVKPMQTTSQTGELQLQTLPDGRPQRTGGEQVDTTSGAALQLLNGPNAGKLLELTKELTTLGKPGVQVAVIARRPRGYSLTHIEGESPALLNGRPLGAQAQLLADHDVIEISGVKMEFFLKRRG